MVGVDKKSFDMPDDELSLGAKADGGQVTVRGISVKKVTFQPGWHWTEHVSSDSCVMRHVGYVISGRLHVVMDDGGAAEIQPGDVVVIQPGHDAWTVGEEACVFVDFGDGVKP